jgi:hypothetical protein
LVVYKINAIIFRRNSSIENAFRQAVLTHV